MDSPSQLAKGFFTKNTWHFPTYIGWWQALLTFYLTKNGEWQALSLPGRQRMQSFSCFQEEWLNVIWSSVWADADAHVVHVVPVVHDWVGVPDSRLRCLAFCVGDCWMVKRMFGWDNAYNPIIRPPWFVDNWSISWICSGEFAHEDRWLQENRACECIWYLVSGQWASICG